MTDIYSAAKRSEVMAKIRGRDTEIGRLRKALHGFGLRFRLNVATLPGRPDIVFPKYRTVVLVHGCFWRRHKGCKRATLPQTNLAFWQSKQSANAARDRAVIKALRDAGWNTLIVWQCEILKDVNEAGRRVHKKLRQTLVQV
jgi:DNA mismatch endonuclease, patch repair protein